jgi:hypothetical protein
MGLYPKNGRNTNNARCLQQNPRNALGATALSGAPKADHFTMQPSLRYAAGMNDCQRRRVFAAALAALLCSVACSNNGRGTALPIISSGGAALGGRSPMAGGMSFTQVGPFGVAGKLNALAIDPSDAKTLYVAAGRGTGLESYSSAGIFKTTDRGAHWQSVDGGLIDSSGYTASAVNGLWIDPTSPSTLMAATQYGGLFRTTNGGTSWANVYRTTEATEIVQYAGALYATSASGILSSADGGATWSVQLAGTAGRYPTTLGAAQGKAGSALYAGMTDGTIYAYASGSWKRTGRLPYKPVTGADSDAAVHQMAVDPQVPATVYATSNDGPWNQNLHASTDGGRTWNTVLQKKIYNVGLGSQAIAFSTVHPHRLYIGSDGAPLLYIRANGSATSATNRGAFTGADIRDIWPVASGADDACYLASDQGLIYVAACSKFVKNGSGIELSSGTSNALDRHFLITPNGQTIVDTPQDLVALWTTDGGRAWRVNPSFGYEDAFNELRPGAPNVCYSYDEAYGFRISTDGCQKYDRASGSRKKLVNYRLMTDPIDFDPANPLHMYVASLAGSGAVYASTNGGLTFARLPWAISFPGAVRVDQRNGAHILVGDLASSSSIHVTFDGGKTWHTSAGVPATQYWYDIAISPVNGSVVLASSVDDANNVFVLRSTNGGRSFSKVAAVVNAPTIRQVRDADRMPAAAAGRDADASSAADGNGAPEYFLYSPSHSIRYNQDVTHGTAMVALTTIRGAYLSGDNGTTWHRIDGSTISHSFWGIRWLQGRLYLASDGQGILRSNNVVQSP